MLFHFFLQKEKNESCVLRSAGWQFRGIESLFLYQLCIVYLADRESCKHIHIIFDHPKSRSHVLSTGSNSSNHISFLRTKYRKSENCLSKELKFRPPGNKTKLHRKSIKNCKTQFVKEQINFFFRKINFYKCLWHFVIMKQ